MSKAVLQRLYKQSLRYMKHSITEREYELERLNERIGDERRRLAQDKHAVAECERLLEELRQEDVKAELVDALTDKKEHLYEAREMALAFGKEDEVFKIEDELRKVDAELSEILTKECC